MSVGRICTRSVLVAPPEMSVREAARLMAEREVGSLVVMGPDQRPLGVLTDRDVTVRCVALGRDPEKTAISDVMTAPCACARQSTSIDAALARMAGAAARRLVVTDDEGRLVGILALDDVLDLLAEELGSIGRLLAQRRPKL